MFLLALSMFLQAAVAAQGLVMRTFDDDKIGAPPPGFALAAGRDAPGDAWMVRREGSGRVLVHEGRPSPPDSFAIAIFSGAFYQDVQVSVRFKTTGGARTAGLVWKYQDPLNHYSAHLDLAKQELAMYRIVNGNRIRIEHEDDLELDPDAWHALKIFQERGRIRVYLGGIRVLNEHDRLPRARGNVGIWAGGDSTVMFDDFRVEDEAEDGPRDAPAPTARPQAARD